MQNSWPEMLFFGAVKVSSHYLHRASGSRAAHAFEKTLPFCLHILDSGLLPKGREQIEGAAGHSQINGWTIVSFWDRSVDKRPGSNSAFVFPEMRDFTDIITTSKVQLPWFWERIGFEVVRKF